MCAYGEGNMRINAYAKINWTLNVVGRRPDGYHELDMLMQDVELCDVVELSEAEGLTLAIDGPRGGGLSAGADNLMLRAARLLREETGVRAGANMRLTKRVPMQAGMGGGSGDAAAVLRGLNDMWRTGLSLDELCALGMRLGADIPYCLTGGLCRVRGVGERIERLPGAPELELLVAMPARGLSTRDVFALSRACPRQDTLRAAQALRAGDWDWLEQFTANDLESAACQLLPEVGRCVELMRGCGARFARMTGSGSAVYGVFGRGEAEAALARVRAEYADCFVTRTRG